MLASVTGKSNGFGGGSYTPSGRPTGVYGPFSSPGVSAETPPGVPSSGNIIEARNNRGSNIRVPYARLVPMHARVNIHASNDKRQLMVKGKPQLEYTGLHQGELAWVLGRRFKNSTDGNLDYSMDGVTREVPTVTERYAHQAVAGLGNGVDRMQRLASTSWMEALFAQTMSGVKIKLHTLQLDSAYAQAIDSSLGAYTSYIGGGLAVRAPDVASIRDLLAGSARYARQVQGIDIMPTGPFLRGMQVDSHVIRFEGTKNNANTASITKPEDLPRNMGDNLAFSALETELRRRNLMDWTPDGIVLSKLESPTDDPMKSTEFDARQAQLFNIGIQGPSITTAWTSDVHDHKLEVQPLDKVFVCMVADLSYVVGPPSPKFGKLFEERSDLYIALRTYSDAVNKDHDTAEDRNTELNVAKAALTRALQECKAKSDAYVSEIKDAGATSYIAALKKVETATSALKEAEDAGKVAAAEAALTVAKSALQSFLEQADEADMKTRKVLIHNIRQGTAVPSNATLSNFALMRTTSSHMTNYSYYKPGDKNSRLGLDIGKVIDNTDGTYSGVSRVIVGGWCIGTVVDSAATRSTIGFQTVKSHPTSMAINLNVDVQWWSGDKLYKHYMDAGNQVLVRGTKRKKEESEDEDKDVYEAAPANAAAAEAAP